MRRIKLISWTICTVFLIVFFYGCIDPFSPPEISSPDKFLVVDGFLNMSADTTKIELRRTQNVSEKGVYLVETGAKLSVESEKGQFYQFQDRGKGVYILLPGTLDRSVKYRLNITTKTGQQYASDFVTVSKTPPIDSITYAYDKVLNAMVVRVNTHDPTNSTRFYRWQFDDTFEYYTPYFSGLEVINKEIVSRMKDISHCWKSGKSANIILGSTIKLSKDEIRDLPISVIPVATNKLLIKYSMLVKQYGLTEEAFEYWTSLAKTTQGTGSLFDPQPSQVTGNIKSKSNPKELVFGYFSASVAQQKRIFMTPGLGYREVCVVDTIQAKCVNPEEECALTTSMLLLMEYGETDVLAVPPGCADCRLQGGTLTRPSFWE